MVTVRTCLWFHNGGKRAAETYVMLVPDSRIDAVHGDEADPFLVDLSIGGVPYQFLTGGPHYTQTPASSIALTVDDQAEIDRLWSALTDGGKELQCGWLTDQFGVTWQVMPRRLLELLNDPDPQRAGRVREAMMKMVKIDIAGLEAAAMEQT